MNVAAQIAVGAGGAAAFILASFFVGWVLLLVIALAIFATEILLSSPSSPYAIAASVGVYLFAVALGIVGLDVVSLATTAIP